MPKRNVKQLIVTLLEKHHLLSATEILEKLEKKGKRFNKTSVYRALDQLLEKDVVCRHFLQKEQASYELRQHHHSHLVCTSCGKVETSDCKLKQPQKINDFTINHHHTTFLGTCATCTTNT